MDRAVCRCEGLSALLTAANERGEIRSINLVPTKAHSAFQAALLKILSNLTIFGHAHPLVFYTDNVAGDSHFLRKCFPPLNLSVVQPSRWSDKRQSFTSLKGPQVR